MRCQCNFEDSDITSAGFTCFLSSPSAVTFRAKITGSQQTTASEMIGFLEEWIASGAFISVEAQLLMVDSSCAVLITSFGEQECRLEALTTSESTTLSVSDDTSSSGVPTSLIGVVIAVLVVVVMALTVVAVLVLILFKHRKRENLKLKATLTQE